MGSPSSPTLDEAHCLWPLCSHACCWEAERRIREGRPRQLKVDTTIRAWAAASEEDRFPVITVVNASEWPDAGSPIGGFPPKSEDDFSEAATNALIRRLALPKGARRQENVHIPSSSSAMPAHLETDRRDKTVKLRTVVFSPLPSYTSTFQSSKPTVLWVPSSCYVPAHDSQHSVFSHPLRRPAVPICLFDHSAKCPGLAVKELTFLPSAVMNKSVEYKKKLKQDRSRKRAVLKRTPLKSQLNQEGKGSLKSEADADPSDPGLPWPGSDSDHQVKKASAPPQVYYLLPVGQTLAAAADDQQPPRSVQTFRLRNKPMVSEPVWERKQPRHTQEEHHNSKYKLDLKTGMDGIDWESLKRQTYLWRRHTQLVNSECRRHLSSEDKADYVPYSLHPIPTPRLHCQSKSPSTTGLAKCRNVDYINGTLQSYSRFLASKNNPCNDDFRFLFSTYCRQNPGQHAINADAKSDIELRVKGTISPPNSQQSSQASSTVKLARNI